MWILSCSIGNQLTKFNAARIRIIRGVAVIYARHSRERYSANYWHRNVFILICENDKINLENNTCVMNEEKSILKNCISSNYLYVYLTIV